MAKDLTGEKFGRLTAIELHHRDKKSNSYWLCKCNCGNEVTVLIGSLTSGNTRSCGCLHTEIRKKLIVERSTTHGLTGERLYNIWHSMKQRCYLKSNISYKYYGGHEIKVCDEWKNDYLSFRKWSMNKGYKDGLSIDRIDVNGDYEPNNCKWSTMKEQQNNKSNNKLITYNGETKTASEWAESIGMNKSTLLERIRAGWNESDALTIPVGNYRKCN